MIPELRQQFLSRWSPHQYDEFIRKLNAAALSPIGFRVSETPVFYEPKLIQAMVRSGQEIYAQLAGNPAYRTASSSAIPAAFRVPDEAEHPLFVQADFGLVRNAQGDLEPRLVEIQGFPSIYALQLRLAQTYAGVYGLREAYLLDNLNEHSFVERLRRAVVADADPQDVALLEVDPNGQKTQADFWITQQLLGIRVVPIEEVEKHGRTLVHQGRAIRRIYNRAIADELIRRNTPVSFEWTDDLEVEWAGHPNWFFRLSKFALPFIQHSTVPQSMFLDKVPNLPRDLSSFVLKPLYSFAGLGVKIGPSYEEVASIPDSEKGQYILQERMDFAPTLQTPSGPTIVETRVMYIFERGELRPTILVVRTGRGKMMGVDFNKNLDWVGASAGFYPVE